MFDVLQTVSLPENFPKELIIIPSSNMKSIMILVEDGTAVTDQFLWPTFLMALDTFDKRLKSKKIDDSIQCFQKGMILVNITWFKGLQLEE